ncbi:bifunctional phosphoribosylaminoimidazolecarboxamide formyltransferase/IMP cyclohydrolase [Flavobacterium sp.]|uniref:bifunctional phosphoribosylaminoimidazolecarboxamide formyltransferase/IMP cyclohydrolase n=1 Tax=Flavobacterium sp. TaxID=239 RepID=UPI00260185B2|nr:bifunctional phosphoribosylaminoimidazolecarboxamide formyltransferase/IMP cyclohydrolase [Flavobacterium sp.]
MSTTKIIKTALISVYSKEGLAPLIHELAANEVSFLSTGGTQQFIEQLGYTVTPVEAVTGYPSILGGRVKTLHPKVFGGILNRSEVDSDREEMEQHDIPQIDLVIVDLYPFEDTVASGASEAEIIEKIDIGGISLIRAGAKNFADTVIVSNMSQYSVLLELLKNQLGATELEQRKNFALEAFRVTSHYDTAIANYFSGAADRLQVAFDHKMPLRYGENPHQQGSFYGNFDALFTKLNGKELSYNNLLDVDAAVNLIEEFKADKPTFAILKHNNACGIATAATIYDAYVTALACDPTSAFGGVLIANTAIDEATAQEINKLFCEVVIAPAYAGEAVAILSEKKNRIVLVQKPEELAQVQYRTALNGLLVQDRNNKTDQASDLQVVTNVSPTQEQIDDLLFASKICKNTKSNTIVLAKNGVLLASGTGQTSRVDALKQAIEKAQTFGFSLQDAVMASDAFFPFPDCVEIANQAGITAVIQPGGSIKDQLSIDYCNSQNMTMVFTGTRHFKH